MIRILSKIPFVLAVASIVATTALASSWPCDTLSSCETLDKGIDQRLTELGNQVPSQIVAPARDAVGNLLHLDLWASDRYCTNLGLRLPSALEMGYFAQAHGALGVSQTPRPGHQLIGGGPSDMLEEFYYSPAGYTPPSGDLGTHWFWLMSSAREEVRNTRAIGGGNGQFFFVDPQGSMSPGISSNAVVCMNAPDFQDIAPDARTCNTVDGCSQVRGRVEARIAMLRDGASTSALTDVPRNGDGSVRYLNQPEALRYCAQQGLRLPTAKELALFARAYGGRVSETAIADYYQVADFFYSGAAFRRAPDDTDEYNLWSSTLDSETPGTMAYVLTYTQSDSGSMPATYSNADHAFSEIGTARCMKAGPATPAP